MDIPEKVLFTLFIKTPEPGLVAQSAVVKAENVIEEPEMAFPKASTKLTTGCVVKVDPAG